MKKSRIQDNKIEASEDEYLYIKLSQLNNAGNGLHTAITIYKDEVIAIYKGEILTSAEANKRAIHGNDKYFIKMLDGNIMDSMNTICFAKYANDANAYENSNIKNNAKIALDENLQICLIATRMIKTNEEIFCSYGKKYWENKR